MWGRGLDPMSLAMLNVVRAYKASSPSAKAVLVAMADYADDSGRCWPSLARLCEFTCLCERAVRNAIRDLEQAGVLGCERASGMTTQYVIRVEIARGTPAPDAGVRPPEPRHQMPEPPGTTCRSEAETPRHQMPGTPAPDAADPGTTCRRPRHLVPPNHQEPPENHQRTRRRGTAPLGLSVAELVADGLDESLATDFLAHRKRKRAELTARAWSGIKAEAQRAGWTLKAAVEKAITRNWVAFEADWVARDGPPQRHSAVHIGKQDFSAGWGK